MFKESVASIVDETIRQKYPNRQDETELRQQISKMENEIESLRSLHAHNWKKRIDLEDQCENQCESQCSSLVTASETRLQQKISAQKRAIKTINGSLSDVISSIRQPNYRNFGDSIYW